MAGIYLKAEQVESAVRTLYAKNGYVVLSQVRNGTGYAKASVRTADMLAVSTWPSRGMFTEGFEIKVSKSDLQSELANPAKADEIARFCTYWWLAVPEGLTDGLLIPPKWGVITVNAKLVGKVAVQAQQLEPIKMDQSFVCAVLRAFGEQSVPKSDVDRQIEAARQKEREDATARAGRRLKELEEGVAKFKEHSGVDLMSDWGRISWDIGDIGDAVRLVRALRNGPIEEMVKAQASLKSAAELLEGAMKAIAERSKPSA